jgi:two-component system, NarL family, response regulator NreC
MSTKEISSQLHISSHTVISHRKNITQKLNIKSVAGLTVFAILNGIINMDQLK